MDSFHCQLFHFLELHDPVSFTRFRFQFHTFTPKSQIVVQNKLIDEMKKNSKKLRLVIKNWRSSNGNEDRRNTILRHKSKPAYAYWSSLAITVILASELSQTIDEVVDLVQGTFMSSKSGLTWKSHEELAKMSVIEIYLHLDTMYRMKEVRVLLTTSN